MAQYDDFAGGPVAAGPARGQVFINMTGAAVSLALVGGMAVWGYKLLVRDVTGVPVIEAIEGAFRTQPSDPGGMTAAHQGLSVNEIAAQGEASPAPEAVRLAPATATLDEEDWPWGRLVEADAVETAGAQVENTGEAVSMALAEDAASADMLEGEVATGATPEAIAADETGAEAPGTAIDRALAEALGGLDLEAEESAASDIEVAQVGPRPVPRPLRNLVRVSAPIAASTPSTEEIDIASLERGTRLVQLGAFVSEDIAREEWRSISNRFPDFFSDKRRVVQQAVSGGKTFYRLRAEGFTDLAEARRFCTALTAGRADCIPVEVR